MQKTREYTITELEEATGQTRRTIHFYIQQGVIPPSIGSGGGAKYGEEHLLRLKLIPLLQQSHLKLSGIKRALDSMDMNQMRRMARESGPVLEVDSPSQLRLWLHSQSAQLALDEEECGVDLSQTSLAELSDPGKRTKAALFHRAEHPVSREAAQSSSTWRRIRLAEGVELHMREDILNRYQALVANIMHLFGRNPK